MRGHALPSSVIAALMLLLGVVLVQWLPTLPPRWLMALLLVVAIALAIRFPRARWLGLIIVGFVWASWRGAAGMDARLPRALEGRDFVVTGAIADLPQVRSGASTFTLRVEHAVLDGQPVALHGLLTIAWYDSAPSLPPCSHWRLLLRLKRPRGLIDPSASDSERSALERGIVATGYVRKDAHNGQVGATAFCINGVRDAISRGIAARVPDPHDAALLQAFSVGDTRGLQQDDWDVARANGVSHLIAISGFHVGVAAVFGVWLAMLLYAIWPRFGWDLPRPQAMAAAALLVAGIYTALAGFGLPTVRTLLMIAVIAVARFVRRGGGGVQSLALAMMSILLIDPLSVLAPGFWLSFVGVSFLMLCLQTRGRGLRAFLHELSAGQMVMTVSLLPLSLWFFGEASLVGALSNLIAVPLISFVIVPCALLGVLLMAVCPPLATPVLWLAAQMAHAQWWLLEQMANWPGAHWYLPTVQPWALLLALLGAVWLFMPRGVPLRWLGLLLFLPLLLPPRQQPAEGAFEAWVLDVGQGLSVIVRTRGHVLVYDAGARYPSGYDLGESVVVPSLHALGLDRVDRLMISHGDNDHAGGAAAVAQAFPEADLYAGEPERMHIDMQACHVGQTWQWDGVRFRVLSPLAGAAIHRDNALSCVLVIDGAGGSLLLPGDIGSDVEATVAAQWPQAHRPTVLVVPHHGSRTSSSPAFIAAVAPRIAVVSTGWRNPFGHPHPEVVQRYETAGIPLLDTAKLGAVALVFPKDASPRVASLARLASRRYWRE